MRTKQEYETLLRRVAEQMTSIGESTFEEACPISIVDIHRWEWAQGVGLYGLFRYYEMGGDASFLDFLEQWYAARIAEGLPEKNVNTVAPMLTLALLAEKTGDNTYMPLMQEWADWVMRDMPRTEEGGLQHIASGVTNEQQLWDDTLFMTVLFLAKFGTMTGNDAYVQESVRQFLLHIKYLTDPKTGLWFHGWTFLGRHHFADALWGRGNCWYTAGVVDYLEMVALPAGVRTFLIDTLWAQVRALMACQDAGGLWHTLLNDPGSYLEASATAGFGYGILKGVRMGYLPDACRETGVRALEAVCRCIAPDGTVEQVSYGTAVGHTLEEYRNIPICPMTYGNALTILLLTEGLRLD